MVVARRLDDGFGALALNPRVFGFTAPVQDRALELPAIVDMSDWHLYGQQLTRWLLELGPGAYRGKSTTTPEYM